MLLEHKYIDKCRIIIAAFKSITDNKEEIYVNAYHNGDDILYKNFNIIIDETWKNTKNII